MVLKHMPVLGKKLKIHLILHLSDNIIEFGPTSSFNTERYSQVTIMDLKQTIARCEAFNSLMRARNIFANRQSPSSSWDIARGFEVLETLRSVCTGNSHGSNRRYKSNIMCFMVSHIANLIYSVGNSLVSLYKSPPVQSYLNGISSKELYAEKYIYQHAALRKVSQLQIRQHIQVK